MGKSHVIGKMLNPIVSYVPSTLSSIKKALMHQCLAHFYSVESYTQQLHSLCSALMADACPEKKVLALA